MPKKTATLAALVLFGYPLLGMGSCGVKTTERLPPEKVIPLQTATLEELLARLERQADAVTFLNAQAELVPSTGSAYSGVIEEYHDVRAFVLAERRPAGASGNREHIRVIGQAPLVRKTIFDMVADDTQFRIYVPPKNKFLIGATHLERHSDKPIENLRPQHLLEALFLDAPSAVTPHLLEENEFAGRRYYGVSEIILDDRNRLVLHRRWWFERTGLTLERVERFDAGGRLVADIHYADWSDAGGISYPRSIELVRPLDDYRLKLLIKEVKLNEPLPAERFRLEPPAGVEVVELKAEPKPAEKESR